MLISDLFQSILFRKVNSSDCCYQVGLKMDHPIKSKLISERKNRNLKDITLKNNKLTRNLSEGAAEFEITPLFTDLRKNRPLRLFLRGVFSDRSISSSLLGEWRSLIEFKHD